MPRITPWRILKLFAFVWLIMIWLWLLLPSPPIPHLERGAHIQRTLGSGKPLITVHDWDRYFNANDTKGDDYSFLRQGTALIIEWRLASSKNQEFMLRIDDRKIDISSLLAQAEEMNQDAEADKIEWTPYFSEPLQFDSVPVGDAEPAVLCFSWFYKSDKHLITHKFHGTTGGMVLRLVVTEPGVVEVWKDAGMAELLDSLTLAKMRAENLVELTIQQKKELFARVKGVKDSLSSTSMLARFEDTDRKSLQAIVVRDMAGDIPSPSYPIRRALLVLLGPTLIAFSFGLFYIYLFFAFLLPLAPTLLLLSLLIGLAISGTTLLCWLRDRRPPFREWTRTFWLTRWVHRDPKRKEKSIWGPAGPVFKEITDDGRRIRKAISNSSV